MPRRFTQVDVFTSELGYGNPVAVVHDAEGVDDAALQRFAAWTNLSETTFLLPPEDPAADYRVRIFTPARELPFAGHPTLGSARAWLEAGGTPAAADVVVQECGAGLVRVRRDGDRLAFAAPPLLRDGPVEADDLAEIVGALGVDPAHVVDAQWGDNGPGWVMVLLDSAETVLALRPDAA
ncbi:PhzF family phenazine biosynthesis protein, partial [Friedmanniella antarctica]|nr:PhzF family phenazine biosynthesis protein [Microlunatus antarcticus]